MTGGQGAGARRAEEAGGEVEVGAGAGVRGEARGAGAEAAGDEQMKRMNEETHNCKKRLLNITFRF